MALVSVELRQAGEPGGWDRRLSQGLTDKAHPWRGGLTAFAGTSRADFLAESLGQCITVTGIAYITFSTRRQENSFAPAN